MLRWYVKELIEARGMSMGKLSRKANLSYETVMKICRNPCMDYPHRQGVKVSTS